MLLDLAKNRPVPASIGEFQSDFWMTSYEASVFLDDDRVGALRRTAQSQRLGEVA
jgi:hypothetical protein